MGICPDQSSLRPVRAIFEDVVISEMYGQFLRDYLGSGYILIKAILQGMPEKSMLEHKHQLTLISDGTFSGNCHYSGF